MRIITDPRCTEYSSRGHPERPQRISRSVELLQSQQFLPITWDSTLPVHDDHLLRAHTQNHLNSLSTNEDFDADTPAYPNIATHSRRGVGGALRALAAARDGEMSFSLLRPPGHHATASQAMGFCYLNSIAIAALEALATGFKRVAVFDFDVHHGNGSEAILLYRPGCTFISVHQYPAYPGSGHEHRGDNCFNFPVTPSTPRAGYRAILAQSLDLLKNSRPDLIAVSAGFDAYNADPLADGTLEVADFHWLGEQIRSFQTPTFSILEGGYSADLPYLILAYLCGLSGVPIPPPDTLQKTPP